MKKFLTIGICALTTVFLAACQGQNDQFSELSETKTELVYSNLLDTKTQESVEKVLAETLLQNNITQFIEQVTFYNQHIPTESLVQSGYGISKKLIPTYDIGAISDQWVEQFPLFPGYNCRLTTFQLLKSDIELTPMVKADDSLLFIEQEAMADAPAIYQLSPEEQERFKIIFGAVATENITDTTVHIAKVQDYWRQQGVVFSNPKVKMISVWFHDQLDQAATKLFIGHVGVLVPEQQGYLFVEKISFEEPYQVLKFADKKAVYNYLMMKYDTDTSGSTQPFIMENDQPFEA